jgi:hypothetical protein
MGGLNNLLEALQRELTWRKAGTSPHPGASSASQVPAQTSISATSTVASTSEDQEPLGGLHGPRRTAWGTLVWSDAKEPPIEAFGDAPPWSGPQHHG